MPRPARETGTAALVATPPPRALDEVLVALAPHAVQRVLRWSRWSDRLRRRVVPRVVRVRVPDPGGHARRAPLLGAVRAVVLAQLVLSITEADGPRRVAGAAHHRVPVPHARVLSYRVVVAVRRHALGQRQGFLRPR